MLSKSIGVGLSMVVGALILMVVYSQPPNTSGGLLLSSRWDPDGSDYDQYVWDNFTLPIDRAISEIHWRGGFDPARSGSGGPVVDFAVSIYPSIPGGSQPDVVNPPLVEYLAGGNAGQTPAGKFGGVDMYDYTLTLPTAFQAVAGTKYWVQIEALQHGLPDWGIAVGTQGNHWYFRRYYNGGDLYYQLVANDAAFSLYSTADFAVFLPLIKQ